MKINNVIAVFAFIAVTIALVNLSVTLIKVSDFREQLTGFASGYVNVTVYTQISINVSTDTIDWGSGSVDIGQQNATLYTKGASTGAVERGNWSEGANTKGIVIENLGSVNASLTLQGAHDAYGLFGSASNTNEQYLWNVSNKEVDSCYGGEETMDQWRNANVTAAGIVCSQFGFNDDYDEIYLDVWLTVPYDATNVTDRLDEVITITASTAS